MKQYVEPYPFDFAFVILMDYFLSKGEVRKVCKIDNLSYFSVNLILSIMDQLWYKIYCKEIYFYFQV